MSPNILPRVDAPGSISRSLRNRRFDRFLSMLDRIPAPRIIDLGGTVEFWRERARLGRIAEGEVTLVNLHDQSGGPDNVVWVEGDVTALDRFPDMEFDAVFSNSVIEHVGNFERQAAMAREATRLAPLYSVQTPNYWFPLEPHFLMPAWQWLPVSVRVEVVRRFRMGHQRARTPDARSARERVESIRLLKRSELVTLFPDGTLVPERVGPFVKSWMIERAGLNR